MAQLVDSENPPPVQVQIRIDDAGMVIVTLSGELDISSVDDVDAQLAPMLATPPAHLILDIAGLTFADSAAITLWLHWAAAAERFELHNPPPFLRQVLEAMGLAGKLGLSP
jgi:anti-sigma B factor antagonist